MHKGRASGYRAPKRPSGGAVRRLTVRIEGKPMTIPVVITSEDGKRVVKVRAGLLTRIIGQRGGKGRVYHWDERAGGIIGEVEAQLAKGFPGHEVIWRDE